MGRTKIRSNLAEPRALGSSEMSRHLADMVDSAPIEEAASL